MRRRPGMWTWMRLRRVRPNNCIDMKKSDLRIAFFGTPALSVFVLDELKECSIVPSLIVTSPDRPVGRKLQLTPSPVKVWAESEGVPVIATDSLKDTDACDVLYNSEWDIFIVAAYNIFLPKVLLELPRYGVLNVHPSLLPKLRGPSPIRSAIRADDKNAVGVSIITLDEEMDHGPLVAQANLDLPEWPVRGKVLDEILFREGGRLLTEVIPLYVKGEIPLEEQDHSKATYSSRIVKGDGELLETDTEYEKYLKFCAYDGWPGVFFFHTQKGTAQRIKVTDATYEGGVFSPLRVVPEGKKEILYADWLRNNVESQVIS